jgi:hypothetical protein
MAERTVSPTGGTEDAEEVVLKGKNAPASAEGMLHRGARKGYGQSTASDAHSKEPH